MNMIKVHLPFQYFLILIIFGPDVYLRAPHPVCLQIKPVVYVSCAFLINLTDCFSHFAAEEQAKR